MLSMNRRHFLRTGALVFLFIRVRGLASAATRFRVRAAQVSDRIDRAEHA